MIQMFTGTFANDKGQTMEMEVFDKDSAEEFAAKILGESAHWIKFDWASDDERAFQS